jgi:hypothetical protein
MSNLLRGLAFAFAIEGAVVAAAWRGGWLAALAMIALIVALVVVTQPRAVDEGKLS